MSPCPFIRPLRGLVALAACAVLSAHADTDKLLLTGGVGTIDGAAGGGLTPWALIGSYATDTQAGATVLATAVKSADYRLGVIGAAVGWHDRVELSFAHQDFDTGRTGAALGLPGLHLKQDVFGAKLRVAGDAILDADTWMPQLAVGALVRRTEAGGLAPTLAALGAGRAGTDLYVSATKLLLGQSVLLNGTLRWTKANQDGLLGFGGSAHPHARLMPEASIAWLVDRHVAIGAEYRAKPDNLDPSALGAGLKEDDWADLFVAWAPVKTVSITAAVVDLGRIVPATAPRRQTGAYLSAQFAF
jgi:hypothetical protein